MKIDIGNLLNGYYEINTNLFSINNTFFEIHKFWISSPWYEHSIVKINDETTDLWFIKESINSVLNNTAKKLTFQEFNEKLQLKIKQFNEG